MLRSHERGGHENPETLTRILKVAALVSCLLTVNRDLTMLIHPRPSKLSKATLRVAGERIASLGVKGQRHARVYLIHVLTAGARRATRTPAQIPLRDHHAPTYS